MVLKGSPNHPFALLCINFPEKYFEIKLKKSFKRTGVPMSLVSLCTKQKKNFTPRLPSQKESKEGLYLQL